MRTANEQTFASHDGREIFYRYWPSVDSTEKGAIVLLHRGHEHSGRVAHLVDELGLPGFAFFAWDGRGHGRSPVPGDEHPHVATMVRDLDCFVSHIAKSHGCSADSIAIVAQSVGAVLAATWVHDYAPDLRALVLAAPAFKVKLYVPFARAGLKLMRRLRGDFRVNSYVKAKFLTHDGDRIASYNTDPLITRPIGARSLLSLYETAERVVADAEAITTPTQMLISGRDWVVDRAPQLAFFENLGTPIKERHIFPDFYHDTLGERDRAQAVDKVRRFVLARFAEPAFRPCLISADASGHTHDEAEALSRPLPAFSPAGLYWRLARLALRLAGSLSRGIGLGHETGFDSGSSLDYVYRNRPEGRIVIGRAIDKAYLGTIGWRGIRRRKRHIEELIAAASDNLRKSNHPIRVLDIAAGHGRYVIDALQTLPRRPESVVLRDISDLNVAQGRNLVAERGLSDIVRIEKGDAFDPDALSKVTPKPTLAIVSGLYELFSDNSLVRRSLDGLAGAVPPGGYLVYTGQPWHPQLEFIARALTSHRGGNAWVMRRRTQGELDQLVARAGFVKISQRIDEWGIFSVSLAQRVAG